MCVGSEMASCLFLHITFPTLHPVSPEPWSAVLKKSAKVLIRKSSLSALGQHPWCIICLSIDMSKCIYTSSSSRDIMYEGASQARWLHRHAIPVPHVGMAGGGLSLTIWSSSASKLLGCSITERKPRDKEQATVANRSSNPSVQS